MSSTLSPYERSVLAALAFGHVGLSEAGAAVSQVLDVLRSRGLLRSGRVTPEGYRALVIRHESPLGPWTGGVSAV